MTSRPGDSQIKVAPQPRPCNACQLSHTNGLASSAFVHIYSRNHYCFLFLWVLRYFTSPRSLQLSYRFRQRSPDTTPVSFEVSLFGHPRITARLPTPRGLSQVTTSFIGSWCQGIHRLPLVACQLQRCSRPLYSSQNTSRKHTPPHPTKEHASMSPPRPNHPKR